MNRVFFTDRDLGKQFPAILAEAGLAVERHGDLFAPDGSDEEWLEHCGRNGRVALSHNKYIRYVPNELAAVVRFSVPLIILVGQAPRRRVGAGVCSVGASGRCIRAGTSSAVHRQAVPAHTRRAGEKCRCCGPG